MVHSSLKNKSFKIRNKWASSNYALLPSFFDSEISNAWMKGRWELVIKVRYLFARPRRCDKRVWKNWKSRSKKKKKSEQKRKRKKIMLKSFAWRINMWPSFNYVFLEIKHRGKVYSSLSWLMSVFVDANCLGSWWKKQDKTVKGPFGLCFQTIFFSF